MTTGRQCPRSLGHKNNMHQNIYGRVKGSPLSKHTFGRKSAIFMSATPPPSRAMSCWLNYFLKRTLSLYCSKWLLLTLKLSPHDYTIWLFVCNKIERHLYFDCPEKGTDNYIKKINIIKWLNIINKIICVVSQLYNFRSVRDRNVLFV